MTPLRMAVLGAGLVGRKHIETIRALPEVAELVAVADPVADRTQFDLGGAAWFADSDEMLDQARPEAIIIATPNNLHAPPAPKPSHAPAVRGLIHQTMAARALQYSQRSWAAWP